MVEAKSTQTAPDAPALERSGRDQASEDPGVQTDEGGQSSALRREMERYAFVKWVLRLLAAALILAGASVAAVVIAGVMVRKRPTYTLVAPPSLAAEADAFYAGEPEANLDDLIIFLNTTLPLMHKVDDRGSPDLLLLRSLVTPAIYEEVRAELGRSARTAKQNLIIQNLVITRIEDVDVKKDRGRVGAYVKGYLTIIIQSRNKHVIMPYRAEVVMDLTPPSRLNRFPFVMVRREVRTDKAATEWDSVRAMANVQGSKGK